MSTYQVISILIIFGTFLATSLMAIIAIIVAIKKK